MYLRAIEMTGFKSFAQRTTIQFHDGITGIVGPNGSGKSNVADALRWVLGEQSTKQLRSVNMQDVIFTGTEYRGKAGCASVKITFDNADHALPIDYEEVVICRRVYQTGENEYLLNHSVCRLKDIRELFYDTGIGQEGYSIIGQGQIEQILSNRAEDRRELLEEAAGIVRYRKRKEEAVRKLQREQQNVDRIKDILHELEYQRQPLCEQAKTAKEYLTLQNTLKSYEINMYLYNTAQLDTQKSVLAQKLQMLVSELKDVSEKIANCRRQQEVTDEQQEMADKQIESLHEQQQQITDNRQELEVQYRVLEEQIRTGGSQIQKNQDRQTVIAQSQTQFQSQQKEIGEQLNQWEQKQDKQNEDYQQMLHMQETLEQDIKKLEEIPDKKLQNQDYLYLQTQLEKTKQTEKDIQHKMQMLQARYEALLNVAERYEGYGYAVKQLMESKAKFAGIHGTVAQLIRTDASYELAIETALGAALQNIVVDTESTAKDCIAYLKKNRYGRATFLPLTTVQAKQAFSNPSVLKETGVIGLASNLVQSQQDYQKIVEYLLGKVVVVDILDHALQLSKKYHYSFRVVTLSGEQLNIGGSVSGGAYKQNSNLLGRQRELGALQTQCQKSQKHLQTVTVQKQEIQDKLQQLEVQIEEEKKSLESKQKEARKKLDDVRKDVLEKRFVVQQTIQQQELLKQQQDQITQQIGNLQSELQQIQKEICTLRENKNKQSEQVKQTKWQIEEAKQKLEQIQIQMNQETARKSETSEQQRKILQQKEQFQEQLSQLDKEKFRLEQQMIGLQENLEQEIQHLWTAYEMTPSQTEAYRQEELHNEKLATLTAKVRQQIRDLGAVNVHAVEEYEQLEARYAFLNGQYQDLELAKQQLQHLIKELDEGMRVQFLDHFGKMNESFQIVFQELFGGGQASLRLAQGEDILEAGVQIIAQPPGKKLQNLVQMSGGEKALTAISLLFAIQRLKPTPFCLLDEIEAALDDANIGRFANYLVKLKKETQFIVITHRKGTMVAADQLYGVTMQEKGISSLVSVRLEEAE